MKVLVQKFGGTSVASITRIQRTARLVQEAYHQGFALVVVVSAMAGVTNQLVGWTRAVGAQPGNSESDVVVSAGEQVTAGLLALALQNLGIPARSWLAWQVPLITDEAYGVATINTIPTDALYETLNSGTVSIVAGFQGVTPSQRLTVLGRGGSDTSAVALAAALKAIRCDIFTDVEGVYTADPRLVPNARCLPEIEYEEMLTLAQQGTKVIHPIAVKIAYDHKIPLKVLSSFHPGAGTLIHSMTTSSSHLIMSHSYDYSILILEKIDENALWINKLNELFQENGLKIDSIQQSNLQNSADKNTIFICLLKGQQEAACKLLDFNILKEGAPRLRLNPHVGKITLVGRGLNSMKPFIDPILHQLTTMITIPLMVEYSDQKVTLLVNRDSTETTIQFLHSHLEPVFRDRLMGIKY